MREAALHKPTFATLVMLTCLALSLPAQAQGSSASRTKQSQQTPTATDGDPDAPVITGRVPNSPSIGPVEVVRQMVEAGGLVLVDPKGVRHPVPDGTYEGLQRGATLVIRGKAISVQGSGDMVLKGKKILQNARPAPAGSNELTLDDTAGHELLSQLPDDTYRSAMGRSLTIRAGKIARLQGF